MAQTVGNSSAALVAASTVVAIALTACSPPADDTTHGPQASESTARLVEQLSIGEESGAEPYLFGRISGAWATADRIYVIDRQIRAVRAYDRAGNHLLDIGRPGQGPGEYGDPSAIAVLSDGTVAIADSLGARVNFYAPDGALVEDRRLQQQKSALGLVLSYDDELFTESWDTDRERMGIQAVGPQGLLGDFRFPPPNEYEPPSVPAGKGLVMAAPYAPSYSWVYAPGGEIVSGVGDAYRFRVEHADGGVQVIERDAAPTPVSNDEAAFHAALATEALRGIDPEARFDPDALPTHKPVYEGFFADRSRRVWVVRPGPGRIEPSCQSADSAKPVFSMRVASGESIAVGAKVMARASSPDGADVDRECWADTYEFDLFDLATGDHVATIAAPDPGFRRPLFADRDTVLAEVMDDAGVARLNVYRLELN